MNEKLNDIIIDTTYLKERIIDYTKILKGRIKEIYDEIILLLDDMLIELKRYENVNYSCRLSLDRFIHELHVMFRIIKNFALKLDICHLMLKVNNLYKESEVK